jgi:sulfoxide reductase heme-binding subunit YedZ
MKARLKKLTLLQVAIHLGAWLPLILLVVDFFSSRLSVNPIQDLEQRTGRTALTLLVLSLACTPLHSLFGWREVLKRRRTLGLYAFMVAAIHLSIFMFLDYGFNWGLILDALVKKRFIIIGVISFLILLTLALTSFDASKRWLGKNWKRLHRLIYPGAVLVILHYALAKKGDLFRLQGDIVRPFIYGLILLTLLIMRIGPIRRFIQAHRLWPGFK